MGQILGRATITINGAVINSKPGASIDPGGVTRATETTDQQSDYTEGLRPAVFRCNIPLNKGVSLVDLNDLSGVTAQFIGDTGQHYVLADAWRVGELPASGGQNGGVDIELHCDHRNCTEVGV